jgi:CheY-like chemotaxis protein
MKNYFDQQGYEPTESFILLAEDDDDDRFIMNDFFASNGYKSKIVSSGMAAVDFLQSLSPDAYPALILLDYSMPLLNGEQVLLFIKTSDTLKHTPVIIYSSEMNDHLNSHLKELGAHTCFSKARRASEWDNIKDAIEGLLFSGLSAKYKA